MRESNRCRRGLAAVTSVFDTHEYASQEHENGRKDHHHGVNGNWMLCGCHAISIETWDECRSEGGLIETRLFDFGGNFVTSLDEPLTNHDDSDRLIIFDTLDLDLTQIPRTVVDL